MLPKFSGFPSDRYPRGRGRGEREVGDVPCFRDRVRVEQRCVFFLRSLQLLWISRHVDVQCVVDARDGESLLLWSGFGVLAGLVVPT